MNYEVMMNGNVKLGEYAPDFNAVTTMGEIKLSEYRGKWVVLFSHPGDFTPVCTTEIIAFAKANTYFEERNTCLIGLSVDSNPSHLAWIYDIYRKTGIKIPFPIIADRNGEIARKYGMIAGDISKTETVRNVYIIDDKRNNKNHINLSYDYRKMHFRNIKDNRCSTSGRLQWRSNTCKLVSW